MITDIAIVGSGIAGLFAALKCAPFAKVTIITKDELKESNTRYAQGGLAAAFGSDDSEIVHVEDTLRAGDGLSNKAIAKILAQESPKRINELLKLGVRFERKGKNYKLSREAVHSRARIIHVSDITGKVVEKELIKKVIAHRNITILEHHTAIDVILKKNACVGLQLINNKSKEMLCLGASKIVLATGGVGQLFAKTTNPQVATGDGIAMAFRAGAVLEDMEFIQFHPTILHDSKPSFLISETLRGEGGLLKNKAGKSFMSRYHRDGELAPRDVVSKFSVLEMKKTRSKNVFLDMTHLDEKYLQKRFPHIYKVCLKYGVDMSKQMIPVSPAAHYICGGIKTDSYGFTNVRNLYAIGECACTQLHGADRLASNSLTEGIVFAARLAQKLRASVKKGKRVEVVADLINPESNGRVQKIKSALQETMWEYVGIIRRKKELLKAQLKIKKLQEKLDSIKREGVNRSIQEVDNMLLLAKLIILSCLRRKESRGTHFIVDYPDRHDNIWQTHLSIDKFDKRITKDLSKSN